MARNKSTVAFETNFDKLGKELPDQIRVEVGARLRTLSAFEEAVRSEVSKFFAQVQAQKGPGFGTFEEEDDFSVDDDFPIGAAELSELHEEEPLLSDSPPKAPFKDNNPAKPPDDGEVEPTDVVEK